VNLTPVYRAPNSPNPARDDDPYAGNVVREFLYIKPLNALLVLDRLSSNSTATVSAASVTKTFLLHVPNLPTVNGNSVTEINGNQELVLTNLLSTSPSYQVVDESIGATPAAPSYYQYRIQDNTSGSQQSYFLHLIQMHNVSTPNLSTTVYPMGLSWRITLSSPGGTAVIILNQGMTSSGGSVGYAASGMPTMMLSLNTYVQSITVTNSGPTWGP
jgi:hypothetical protein